MIQISLCAILFFASHCFAMQLQESHVIDKTRIIEEYDKFFRVAKYLCHFPEGKTEEDNKAIQVFFKAESDSSISINNLKRRFSEFHQSTSKSKLQHQHYLITVLSIPNLPHDVKARMADYFSRMFVKNCFPVDRGRFIQGFSSQAVLCFPIRGKFIDFGARRRKKQELCIQKLSSKISEDIISLQAGSAVLTIRDFLEIFYATIVPMWPQIEKDFPHDEENVHLLKFMNDEVMAFVNIWKEGYGSCFCDNYFDLMALSNEECDDNKNKYSHMHKLSYLSVAKKRLLTFEEEFLLDKIISGDALYKMTDADVAIWSEIKKKIKPNESHYSADNIYNSKIDIEELPVSLSQKIFEYTLCYTPILIAGFLPDYISWVCNQYRWLYHLATASSLYLFGAYIFPKLDYAYSPQVRSLKHFLKKFG